METNWRVLKDYGRILKDYLDSTYLEITVKIQSSKATHLLNSKAEHRQPALLRVRMVRENDDENPGRGRGQGGRRRRGT